MPANRGRAVGTSAEYGMLFRFRLAINGDIEAEFHEMGGLSVEREVKQYQEGGTNDFVHVLPGRVRYSNISLKRGMTNSAKAWNWFQTGLYDGQVLRQKVSIEQLDETQKVIRRWDVADAFPVKYVTSEFKAGNSALTIETLELAHHGITLNEVA